jgi:hypothetical protein
MRKGERDTLKAWWQTQLAGGLFLLVVALIFKQWALSAISALIAVNAAIVMLVKSRKAGGRPWS